MQVRLCLLGALLVMAACGSSSAPPAATTPTAVTTSTTLPSLVTVTIPVTTGEYDTNKTAPPNFMPGGVEVAVGGTVTWKNDDVIAHVTANSANAWNAPLASGGSFSRVFPTAGSFEYRCTIHPAMTGTVTVK
jgi:plastocyanin